MDGKFLKAVFVSAVFCLLLPPLASTQHNHEAMKALQTLKLRSESSVRTRWHDDRGTVRSLYNLTIPAPAGTPETSARRFLNDHRSLFGMTDPGVELRLEGVQQSLTGRHIRLRQYYRGVEVCGGDISVHTDRFGQVRVVHSNYFPKINTGVAASLPAGSAVDIAVNATNAYSITGSPQSKLVIFPNREALKMDDYTDAYRLAHRVIVRSQRPAGTWEYIIDASTGEIMRRRNLLRFFEGQGRVFNPNPVVALQDTTLEDMSDSDKAIPEEAYSDVTLLGLDGSGYLDGIHVSTRLTTNRAYEPSLEFNYSRRDDRFEEVMAYYHIDSIARYIIDLGFDSLMSNWQVPVNAHVSDEDNAFYDPFDGSINFGDGGIDNAEDAEAIAHEYGHAIWDKQISYMEWNNESDAMSEGLSDFLAAGFFSAVSNGFGDTRAFDWVFSAGTGGRSLVSNKHYPEDMGWDEHDNGKIWSACLWQFLEAMGRDDSIKMAVESLFYLAPDARFIDGALAIEFVDLQLNEGANADLIQQVFADRGIYAEPTFDPDAFEDNDVLANAKAVELSFLPEDVEFLTIDSAGDDDYYKFELYDDRIVHVSIRYRFFNGSDYPLLGLVLMDSSGGIIEDSPVEVSEAYQSENFVTTGPMELTAGTYVVAVLDNADVTTDYELLIAADIEHPVEIGDGYYPQFIDFPGDVDKFPFDGQKGQLLDIIVHRRDKGSKTDTFLELYDSDDKLLMKSDDVAYTNPHYDPRGLSRIPSFSVPSDGVYYVVINNVDDNVGGVEYGYDLTIVEDDHAECFSGKETPIGFGESVTGMINYYGDIDGFRFPAKKGQFISVEVEPSSNGFALKNGELYIWSPNREIVARFETDPLNPVDPYIDRFRIPMSGNYCITISYYNGAPERWAQYSLTLTENLDDHAGYGSGEETPLVFGERMAGSIDFEGDDDGFYFLALKGQVIALEVAAQHASSPLDAFVELFDASGGRLESVDDYGFSKDPILPGFEITGDGIYYVRVSSYEGGGSDYTYTLILSEGKIPEDDHGYYVETATEIILNEPVAGTINYPNDDDLFVFSAAEGDIISIDIDAAVDGSSLDSVLALISPEEQILKWSDDHEDSPDSLIRDFQIPADGSYYVGVAAADANGGNDYSYTLLVSKAEDTCVGLVYPQYDVNQDGKVDIFDLVIVGTHFGEIFADAAPGALFGQPRSASPEGSLHLSMKPSVNDTRQLTVSVEITPIADLYGYHLSLYYDPNALELLSASPDQALTGGYWNVSPKSAQVNVTQTRQGATKGVNATGSLVTLVFNVRDAREITPQSSIGLATAQFADSQARAIPISAVDKPAAITDLFPAKPVLLQNYPNPFNPETWIPYKLSVDSDVLISIYDIKGTLVRRLDLGRQNVGTYVTRDRAAYWDGRNDAGEQIASGLYFFSIRTDTFTATRKMAVKR